MSHLAHSNTAIIGAGPYALSVAAHLQSHGVEFRIFGTPMATWRQHMPTGMYLKSEGLASSLFDPAGDFDLKRFCTAESLPYADTASPVSLETFVKYAMSFQERYVPHVEDIMVAALDRGKTHFELRLANGETLSADKVIIATGVSHAASVPTELAGLPTELASHSSRHSDLRRFRGRSVTVIGAGQSALETAALLHEADADVLLVARKPTIAWNNTPASGRRSLYQRLRYPDSELGPGLGPWLYSNVPGAFRYLPRAVRTRRVQRTLGPAGAWWLRNRVESRVAMKLGHVVDSASIRHDRVQLKLRSQDGTRFELATDHVIAATGYRFRVDSLPFLSENLRQQVRLEGQGPVLSANFESSVSGLYFTSLASVHQFGPAMRFLHGAGYTARQVSRDIAAKTGRRPEPAAITGAESTRRVRLRT